MNLFTRKAHKALITASACLHIWGSLGGAPPLDTGFRFVPHPRLSQSLRMGRDIVTVVWQFPLLHLPYDGSRLCRRRKHLSPHHILTTVLSLRFEETFKTLVYSCRHSRLTSLMPDGKCGCHSSLTLIGIQNTKINVQIKIKLKIYFKIYVKKDKKYIYILKICQYLYIYI